MSDFHHDLEAAITEDVTRALEEDIRSGDLTALLVPEKAHGHAQVVSREAGVICGTVWFERCFSELDPDVELYWHVRDGDAVGPEAILCEVAGNARALLTGERAALNFLQLLSGVATRTREFVDAVAGTRAKIFDTRKTLPGLRMAQKYAVRVGGGHNHRIGLYDGILIKENHIAAAGGIEPVMAAAKSLLQHQAPVDTMLEIEVENLAQLKEALVNGARLVLLDNMLPAEMKKAVAIAEKAAPDAELEASGGVNLKTVRAVAETGVQRISVGALTKDIKALDLSMRFGAL